jgi:hypothetical protein
VRRAFGDSERVGVNVEHDSKKSEPLVHLPDLKKLEEEIKSEFYELRHGKIWFNHLRSWTS